ncbi:bifunctional serine/threonine-protein kinase/ABC transporter substrate-binding protein [Actinokineospora iranica]|uniref:ABC-type branched-chain amino acid transport system, substrate-binding protein n=1 Tax=Actinokineospora iranica TaxID=1271860 RepID=A0A1G6U6V2_9PSEU|nr:bifunctional serine/threonine-protein kinase/ABC transporter substrate-binding protein [Actinokineospora iranica]SDD36944.1 ABC-type branched-chain amino acid transport system, substrate-binding protein [Actinokineospora iranica]
MTAATFGTYRLDGELGRGGMGIVYRAFDTELERHVALKVLPAALSADPDFRERFRREARAAARLTAPQVVPIHRFGEVDGQLFLDMRLIEGMDLAALLRANGPLEPRRAVAVITAVAAALDAAKAQGLLHRDVKPANILVAPATADAPESAYLGDFGIARSIDPSDRSRLTTTGNTVGTLAYMAPERFTSGQVDHGVDVYSLACVLHECLTGGKPFPGEGALAMMHAHCYLDPPVLGGPLAALGQVITRGMAKNPADRPASAGEFAAAAQRALTAEPADPPTTRTPPTRSPLTHVMTRPAGRSPLVWIVPLASVVVAAILVVALVVVPNLAVPGTATPKPGGDQAGQATSCSQDKGTLTVGVIAPLTGPISSYGRGIRNSAQLAVDQANERCAVQGYKLVLDARDDEARPEIGAQAATALAGDATVVGVVGTLNSSVAQETAPVLAAKTIAQISPANTYPELTRGPENSPDRLHDNYFRVCATDDSQGPFAADHLAGEGKTRVAVVTDGKAYGERLGAEFERRAAANGMTVVAREIVRDNDFGGALPRIKAAAPEAVYFGGEYPQGGPLAKQAADAGLAVPVVGGDGIFAKEYLSLGGRDGDLATAVGAPAAEIETAADFVAAYEARGFGESFSAYGPMAYDAANVIISSVAATVGDGDWDPGLRPHLLTAIGAHTGAGATGPLGFDEHGDTTNPTLTVYEVRGGQWHTARVGTANR